MKIVFMALYDYHSMGVRGLHSLLEAKGYDVKSIYLKSSGYLDSLYTKDDVDAVVGWVADKKPDFFGVGVRSPMLPLYLEIVRRVIKELPGCKIIMGGAHATAVPEECLDYANYVVAGEGENAILDILNGASEGVVRGEPVADLDSLPFPYYGENAIGHGNVYKINKMSYNTSRGCFFKCSYCQESVGNAPRRRRSVDCVSEDIYKINELFPSVKVITFCDSIFAHDEQWLQEFGDEFIGSKMKFWGNGYAPLMGKDTLRLLIRSGFHSMRIGVQSGSQKIRSDIFNRHDDLAKILEVAQTAHKMNFSIHYDFILENPYETAETLRETRDFIKKLPSSAVINKFELRYWPGTPLTKKALRDGVISANDVAGSFMRVGAWSYTYQRTFR